jgi:hypothetical protein
MNDIPLIDIEPLTGPCDPVVRVRVARRIGEACEDTGFFAVIGHGVAPETVASQIRAGYCDRTSDAAFRPYRGSGCDGFGRTYRRPRSRRPSVSSLTAFTVRIDLGSTSF